MDAFQYHIEDVLKWEGGYVFDPADPGGETNMGISKKAFPSENIKTLTKERAIHLYELFYWIPALCAHVPPELMGMHLDTAVNCGVTQAIKILQRASGIKADGVFGKNTKKAAQECTPESYVRERIAYYERLVENKPELKKFLKGWTNRAQSWIA